METNKTRSEKQRKSSSEDGEKTYQLTIEAHQHLPKP